MTELEKVQTYIYEGIEFGVYRESGYWFAISRMKHLKFAFEADTYESAIRKGKAAIYYHITEKALVAQR